MILYYMYREVVHEYAERTQKLAMKLIERVCDALELDPWKKL